MNKRCSDVRSRGARGLLMLYERSWSMKMEIQPPGRRNRRNRRNVYTRKGISQHSELRSCAARKLDRQKKVISQHSERHGQPRSRPCSRPRGLPCATAAGLTANATWVLRWGHLPIDGEEIFLFFGPPTYLLISTLFPLECCLLFSRVM